jgi:hypothetical protein
MYMNMMYMLSLSFYLAFSLSGLRTLPVSSRRRDIPVPSAGCQTPREGKALGSKLGLELVFSQRLLQSLFT